MSPNHNFNCDSQLVMHITLCMKRTCRVVGGVGGRGGGGGGAGGERRGNKAG